MALTKTVMVRGLYNCWDQDASGERLTSGPLTTEAGQYALRALWQGYEEGDKLRETWTHKHTFTCALDYEHDCGLDIAELFFVLYNGDDRIDAMTERSMSVGDVVEIAFDEGDIRRYSCEKQGFKRLLAPGGQ